MKIGVIGCGGMGTTHYQALKALSAQMDVQVVALAECREDFLAKAAALFPGAKTYFSGMELLDCEKLDVVHICLPSYMHVSHAVKAMEKGMNVFLEKPVCLSEEEGRILLEAEKRTGVLAMAGQVVRSFDEYKFLKEAYDKGIYGRLKSVDMKRLSGDVTWGFGDWFHHENQSGSVVLDLHIHDLDFLRYMLGEPDSIDVRAAAFPGGMVNQVITAYQFGDVFAIAEGLWDVSPSMPFEASFRASFEKATVVFNSSRTPALHVYHADGTVEIPELKPEYAADSDMAGINISNLGPYYTEIKYFIECVRDGRKIELAPLREGVKSVLLARAELEKAKKYLAR